MNIDPQMLKTLREDAELHAVDFGRASIGRTSDGSYIVRFERPRFDTAPWSVPAGETVCRTAGQAEVTLLRGLIALHRAERLKARTGYLGWDNARICHEALKPEEIAEHCARVAHAEEVERLREQLAEAVVKKSRRETAVAGAAQLAERYGLRNEPARPTNLQGTAVSANPAKRPVGRPRKATVQGGA